MKSLYKVYEGMSTDGVHEGSNTCGIREGIFDIDDNLDNISREVALQSAVKSLKAEDIKEVFIEYLNGIGEKRSNKKFKKKNIEVGIYDKLGGFTMVDWKNHELWIMYEFYPDSWCYGDADEDTTKNINSYRYEGVWEISRETWNFLKDLFFDVWLD